MPTWPNPTYTTLTGWMEDAVAAHPLRQDSPGGNDLDWALEPLEVALLRLVTAAPERLGTKQSGFAHLRSWEELMAWRAELLVADLLIRSGVGFACGDPRVANPDFVLADGLGLEVTSKAPKGARVLVEELESSLRGSAPDVTVHLKFSEHPTRIPEELRSEIAHELVGDVGATGLLAHALKAQRLILGTTHVIDRGGTPLEVRVEVTPRDPRAPASERVTWEVIGADLAKSLDDVERVVFGVLKDEAKQRQAQSRSTLLLVEIGRVGPGWLRSPLVWEERLRSGIPLDCEFVGVGILMQDAASTSVRVAIATSPGCGSQDRVRLDNFKRLVQHGEGLPGLLVSDRSVQPVVSHTE